MNRGCGCLDSFEITSMSIHSLEVGNNDFKYRFFCCIASMAWTTMQRVWLGCYVERVKLLVYLGVVCITRLRARECTRCRELFISIFSLLPPPSFYASKEIGYISLFSSGNQQLSPLASHPLLYTIRHVYFVCKE
jgi:hypothetical protein